MQPAPHAPQAPSPSLDLHHVQYLVSSYVYLMHGQMALNYSQDARRTMITLQQNVFSLQPSHWHVREDGNVRLHQRSASHTTAIMPVLDARTFMRTVASGRINKMQQRRIASCFSPGTKFAAEVGEVERSFPTH